MQKRFLATITLLVLLSSFLPGLNAAAYSQVSAINYLKNNPVDEWSVMALASINALSGVNLNFLDSNPGTKATDIEKRILARVAADLDDSGLANQLAAQFNGIEIGAGQDLLNDDIFGLLALAAANKRQNIQQQLVNFIKQNQNSDGGWGFAHAPTASDSNDTAMAVMALLASGENSNSQTIKAAFEYLSSTKTSTGYAFNAGFGPDTASTAWVLSAFHAGGRNAPASAVTYLQNQQRPDGSFVWQSGSSGTPLMTAYAAIALNNDSYPVRGISGDTDEGDDNGGQNTPATVGGRAVDQFGQPVPGVQIDTCHHGIHTTGTDGRWSLNLPDRERLCARIAHEPAGFSHGTSTNNTPETAFAHTYEFQVAGIFCRELDECADVENQWDIKDDLGLNFVLQNHTPSPQPAANHFQVAVINGQDTLFLGSQTFQGFSLTDASGSNHTFNQPRAIGTVVHSGLPHVIKNTSFGLFVESINNIQPQGARGWMYAVNGTKPNVGAADYTLKDNDKVIWFYGEPRDNPPPFPGSNNQHKASTNLSVNVTEANNPPTISLSASKNQIQMGEHVTLTWHSENASHVKISTPNDWAAGRLSGSISFQPIIDTTYAITVEGLGGAASAQVTVQVKDKPSIVFGVDTDSIIFGNVTAGEASPVKTVSLINNGIASLEVTTSLEQADEVYHQGLLVGGTKWNTFRTNLAAGSQETTSLQLQIPPNYEGLGKRTGTLIFWAQAKQVTNF